MAEEPGSALSVEEREFLEWHEEVHWRMYNAYWDKYPDWSRLQGIYIYTGVLIRNGKAK